MAITSKRVTVTTTRAVLYTATGLVTVQLRVNASSDVMIGGANLTLRNGFTLVANRYFEIQLKAGEAIYAMASTGTHDVFLLVTE